MSFFVYIHTCPNQKRYVGITTKKPELRWKNGKGYLCNEHFTNAINKYGWDNIEHEVFETQSVELIVCWERILIYHYNTMNIKYGFNHTSGGELNKKCSDDTKKKISNANKGRKHSEETKRKISNANKGHKCSDDTKKKISNANKGRKLTDEHKMKLSKAHKRRKTNKHRVAIKLYWENKRKNNT